MLIPFVFAVILALMEFGALHFYTKSNCLTCNPKTRQLVRKIVSFGIGVTVIYLLAELLPIVYTGGRLSVYAVVLGFTFFFLMEKHIYKHVPKENMKTDLQRLHAVVLLATGILEGFVIVQLAGQRLADAILFFVPIFFISATDDFSLHFIHGEENTLFKILAACAVLIGVIIASFTVLPLLLERFALGLVAGALIFIVVNEVIPKEKKGRTGYFLLGMVGYVLLELFLKYLRLL